MFKRIFNKYMACLLSLAAVFAIGLIVGSHFKPPQPISSSSHSLRLQEGQFTSPLLLGDVENDKDSLSLTDFSDRLKDVIDGRERDGSLTTASVFYRALQSGNQITINDDQKYFPASLTKVPLMMAYLKMGESDPSLLTTQGEVDFDQGYNAGQEIIPTTFPVSGQEYTINDLLAMMIESSDNTSFNLLINKPGAQDTLKQVYDDFQLHYPFNEQVGDVMTAREFSRFLRALYNATYLRQDDSEKALELMSKSDFKNGIVAGVPSDVQVAHKFGLNTNYDSTGTVITQRELHDCGIVYHPTNPYVLCIMTKSATPELKTIEGVIKQISAAVYAETDKK
jgi:beta-lactamase class A